MRIILAILIVLTAMSGYSERVHVAKAGKLKGEIKKHKLTDVASLSLSGELNDKDMEMLGRLPNLVELEFADVVYRFDKKNRDSVITLPDLPKLTRLLLSPEWADGAKIRLSGKPGLSYIKTPWSNSFSGLGTAVIDTVDLTQAKSRGRFEDPVTVKTVILDTDISGHVNKFFPQGKMISYVVPVYGRPARVLNSYSKEYSELLEESDIILGQAFKDYPDSVVYINRKLPSLRFGSAGKSGIKKIVFTSERPVPDNRWRDITVPDDITVIVPKGAYPLYKPYFTSPVFEKDTPHTYRFASKRGGQLRDYLNSGIIDQIDTLVVSGEVVAEDFLPLKQASNMRVLDVSGARIVKSAETIRQERYKIAKDYINRIMLITGENCQNAEEDFYRRQVGLSLLGAVFGQGSQMADARGTLTGQLEKQLYDNIESKLKAELKSLKSPAEMIDYMSHRCGELMEKISGYYDGTVEILNEFRDEKKRGDEWELLKNPWPTIETLDPGVVSKFKRGLQPGERTDIQIGALLTQSDPRYEYKTVWGGEGPERFKLYRKWKKLNLGFEQIYSLERELQKKLRNLSVEEAELPRYIAGSKNLNTVIKNGSITRLPAELQGRKAVKMVTVKR